LGDSCSLSLGGCSVKLIAQTIVCCRPPIYDHLAAGIGEMPSGPDEQVLYSTGPTHTSGKVVNVYVFGCQKIIGQFSAFFPELAFIGKHRTS